MKTIFLTLLLTLLSLHADPIPSAERILSATRYVTTLTKTDLKGNLKKGNSKIPVQLFMREKDIQLQYDPNGDSNWKGMHLELNPDSCELHDVDIANKKTTPFPDSKLGKPISGTDLTYEDLSMRFLYWPSPELKGEKRLGIHDCYVLHVYNPDKRGNYAMCILYIHKKAAALMQVDAYSWKGKHIKTFKVSDLMRVGEQYTIEKMKVETIQDERTISISYLIFDRPKSTRSSNRKLR